MQEKCWRIYEKHSEFTPIFFSFTSGRKVRFLLCIKTLDRGYKTSKKLLTSKIYTNDAGPLGLRK